MLKQKLYEQRGKTSIFIDVSIKDNGDLELLGHDIGDAPRKYWGEDDYEYFLTVPHHQKERLLSVLIKQRHLTLPATAFRFITGLGHRDRTLLWLIKTCYRGNPAAVSDFRALLESEGISYRFETW